MESLAAPLPAPSGKANPAEPPARVKRRLPPPVNVKLGGSRRGGGASASKAAKVEEERQVAEADSLLDELVRAAEAKAMAAQTAKAASTGVAGPAGVVLTPPPWTSAPLPPAPTGLASTASTATPSTDPVAMPHPKMVPDGSTRPPEPAVPPKRSSRIPEPVMPPAGANRPAEPKMNPPVVAGPPPPPKVPPPLATMDGRRLKAAPPCPVAPQHSSDATTGCYSFLPGESSRQRQWRLWGVWRTRGGQRNRDAWYNIAGKEKKPLLQLVKEAVWHVAVSLSLA
eukprot:s4847_g5.t1